MQFTDGEELEQTMLNAPIGICLLDAVTLVALLVNDKFLEVAGKPYDAVFGKHFWDAFGEVRVYYESALEDVIATGKSYFADEVEMKLIRSGKPGNYFCDICLCTSKRFKREGDKSGDLGIGKHTAGN